MGYTNNKELQEKLRAKVKEEVAEQLTQLTTKKRLVRPPEVLAVDRILIKEQKGLWRPLDHMYSGSNHFSVSVTKNTKKKAMKFLSYFVIVAKKRGYEFIEKYGNSEILINGMGYPFKIREKTRRVHHGDHSWARQEPTGILVFRYGGHNERSYEDSRKPLFEYLPNIFASLEVFVQLDIEQAERTRLWRVEYDKKLELKRKENERSRIEKERVDKLVQESEDWHKAEKLRGFIREAIKKELRSEEWIHWANKVANSIDPFLNV